MHGAYDIKKRLFRVSIAGCVVEDVDTGGQILFDLIAYDPVRAFIEDLLDLHEASAEQ